MFDGKLREIEGSTLAFNFWLAFRLLACSRGVSRRKSQVEIANWSYSHGKRLKKSTKSEGSTLAFVFFGPGIRVSPLWDLLGGS